MLTWLLSFVSGPVITGLIGAYKAKLAATNTTDQIAANLAIEDLKAQIEAKKTANDLLIHSPLMFFVAFFMAAPVAVYINKLILWDKIIMHGMSSTDPLTGWIGVVATTIVGGLFGTLALTGTANVIARRFTK